MPYADPHSEAAIASQRRRAARTYLKHREKNIARAAAWNKANAERVRMRSVEWRSTRRPPNVVLYWNARNRAKAQGIPFDLTPEDLVVPAVCPVLGIPLKVGTGYAQPGSPSVDRFDPTKGYTRDNARVISHKANTIKSNATIAELRAVLAYMENNNG